MGASSARIDAFLRWTLLAWRGQAGSSAGRTESRAGAEWSTLSDLNALLASAERKHQFRLDRQTPTPGIAVGRDPGGGELPEGRVMESITFWVCCIECCCLTTSPPPWDIFTCRNGGNWRYQCVVSAGTRIVRRSSIRYGEGKIVHRREKLPFASTCPAHPPHSEASGADRGCRIPSRASGGVPGGAWYDGVWKGVTSSQEQG